MLQYLNYVVAGILLVLSGLFSGLTLGLNLLVPPVEREGIR